MSAIALFSPISGSTTAFGAIIPASYEDDALVNDSDCSPSCFDHDGAIRQYIGTTRLPSHFHPRSQRSLRRRGDTVQDGWRCRRVIQSRSPTAECAPVLHHSFILEQTRES